MPQDKECEWNQPPRDQFGNVITVDDPKYQEKLRDAFQAGLERDIRNGGLEEKLKEWSRKRSSPDINVAMSTVHTPQQKAGVVLESLDPRFKAGGHPEVQAAIKELQRIKDTPMGQKPESVAYEIYLSLRELARDAGTQSPEAHGFFSAPIDNFTAILVQNDLISTTPYRARG
jgi:hypothetical protein